MKTFISQIWLEQPGGARRLRGVVQSKALDLEDYRTSLRERVVTAPSNVSLVIIAEEAQDHMITARGPLLLFNY